MTRRRWQCLGWLLLLIALSTKLVGWVTESWWFDSIGYAPLYRTMMLTRAVAFAIGALLFGGIVYANARIARRVVAASRESLSLQDLKRGRAPEPRAAGATVLQVWGINAGIAAFTLLAGMLTAQQWILWLRWLHPIPLSTDDPVFERDLGFYLFQLPALNFAWMFVFLTGLTGLVLAVAIYLYDDAFAVSHRRLYLPAPALRHLALAGAALLIWKAVGYRLSAFDLLLSQRGNYFGAGYTDVHWRLPIQAVLAVVAFVAAGLLGWWGWQADARRALWPPLVYCGLTVLIGAVVPEVMERTTVRRDTARLEAGYVASHLEWTRRAYGLDQVSAINMPPLRGSGADLKQLTAVADTLPLWPPAAVDKPVDTTAQEASGAVAHTDCYRIDHEIRPVLVAAAALPSSSVANLSWSEAHLQATHGLGISICDATRTTVHGTPLYYGVNTLPVRRPEVYFGEFAAPRHDATAWPLWEPPGMADPVPAGLDPTGQPQDGSSLAAWPPYVIRISEAAAGGGVPLGSRWRQILLGWRFLDAHLASDWSVPSGSRLLWHREVLDRCRQIAPFLSYEGAEPYPIVTDAGRIVWIVDAFCLSASYPYSQPLNRSSNFNYIRNIAKLTVDAYSGEVRCYATDDAEPFTRIYGSLFPGLFRPLDTMPPDVRRHLHYPAWLLETQAAAWLRYHAVSVADFRAPGTALAPALMFDNELSPVMPLRALPAVSALVKVDGASAPATFCTIKPLTTLKTAETLLQAAARQSGMAASTLSSPLPDATVHSCLIGTVTVAGTDESALLHLYSWKPPVPCTLPVLEAVTTNGRHAAPAGTVEPATDTSFTLAPVGDAILYARGLALAATSSQHPPLLNKTVYLARGANVAGGATVQAAWDNLNTLTVAGLPSAALTVSQPHGSAATAIGPQTGVMTAKAVQRARSDYEAMQGARARGDWAAYGVAERRLGTALGARKP